MADRKTIRDILEFLDPLVAKRAETIDDLHKSFNAFIAKPSDGNLAALRVFAVSYKDVWEQFESGMSEYLEALEAKI